MKGKLKFAKHAKERLHERVDISIKNKNILSKKFIVVKKLTRTRSLYYGFVDGKPIKLIYSNSIKKVVTVLPLNYDYQFLYETCINGEIYKLIVFPDCFIETDNCYALTQFTKLNNENGEWEKVKMSSKKGFLKLFREAWKAYNFCKTEGGISDNHEKIQTTNNGARGIN